MSRILVIPHVLNHPVRVREVEIANVLSRRHEVVLLTERKQGQGLSKVDKAAFHLRNLLWEENGGASGGPRVVAPPMLAFKGKPAEIINRKILQSFVASGDFDVVINAGFGSSFAIDPPLGCKYIVDIVDNHIEGAALYDSANAADRIQAFFRREVQKASAVTVVSENLKGDCQRRWGVSSSVIPNGVWIDSLRAVDRDEVEELRARLDLNGRFVFGYIGGMDRFIDVDVVMGAFGRVLEKHPDSVLLWIGPGELYEKYRGARDGLDKSVRFLGPVPVDQASTYISLFDVGLIPKKISGFTNAMMPIKSVEYGAARIPVLASPLEELERLKFPNVKLVKLEVGRWAEAMLEARATQAAWDPAWDSVYDAFDWDRIAGRFEELIR